MGSFWHSHTHSQYSVLDGMTPVKRLVARAHKLGQPAMALTDHGVMSGAFQLYKETSKLGMLAFPGIEAYVVDDVLDKEAGRFHLTLNAFTTKGYQWIVKLSTMSHERERYHFKPRIDWADMEGLAEDDPVGAAGVAAFTGCYFGVLIRHYEDDKQALDTIARLQSIFPRLYIEMQQHNTKHEDGKTTDHDITQWLSGLSRTTGVPPIVTQDCHYCVLGEKDLHDRMKMLAYGGTDAGDVGFPGDAYHLASERWMRKHFAKHPSEFEAALTSLDELVNDHQLSIPTLDKYKYFVPGSFKRPMAEVEHRCRLAVNQFGPKYKRQLEYELGVIRKLKFADYFLLVANYTEWCRTRNIKFNARGSANGSLVCYLMGITSVDPIKWKLSFDRFLTLDRERPPDIDLDVEDVRRDEVIDYLRTKYEVGQIGTYNRLGVDEETGRGSMFVSWMASRKRALPGPEYGKRYGRVNGMDELKLIEPHVVDDLYKLGDMQLLKSPGAHAAGYVLSAPGLAIGDWMPMMLIPSSGSMVTQMTMEDVEDAGYVKIDLLGLRSLTTLHRIEDLLGLSAEFVPPLDDPNVFKFLRQGNAGTGIFQMEGYTAAKGCRELRVKSVKDLILVNALYRPAARDSGYQAMFLRRRNRREDVSYPHPIFEPHLKETLGVPTFQEQVLDVLRELGFDPVGINQILKAVKRSGVGSSARNDETFAKNYEQFMDLCTDAGMTDKQIEESWYMVEGFARYGFNRAHSTAYSLLGYELAWYKVNHPLEFHTALLDTTAGTPKETEYVRETRRCGVRILPPDVNISGASWTLDRQRKAIRRGLVSIKGIGEAAADELWSCSPYESIEDLIERCNSRAVTGGKDWAKKGTLNGTLLKLREANALHSLGFDKET